MGPIKWVNVCPERLLPFGSFLLRGKGQCYLPCFVKYFEMYSWKAVYKSWVVVLWPQISVSISQNAGHDFILFPELQAFEIQVVGQINVCLGQTSINYSVCHVGAVIGCQERWENAMEGRKELVNQLPGTLECGRSSGVHNLSKLNKQCAQLQPVSEVAFRSLAQCRSVGALAHDISSLTTDSHG